MVLRGHTMGHSEKGRRERSQGYLGRAAERRVDSDQGGRLMDGRCRSMSFVLRCHSGRRCRPLSSAPSVRRGAEESRCRPLSCRRANGMVLILSNFYDKIQSGVSTVSEGLPATAADIGMQDRPLSHRRNPRQRPSLGATAADSGRQA